MEKYNRRGLILMAMAVVTTVSAAAAWIWLSTRLPDPASADRDGLMRWMVLRDLSLESPDVRATLVERLERELRGGIDLTSIEKTVEDPSRRDRFWGNVDVLLEDWFVHETAQFARRDTADRTQYLDARIDDILTWQYVQQLRRDYAAGTSNGDLQLLAACQRRIDTWTEGADSDQASQMNRFVAAIKTTLLRRFLTGTLPPLEDDA